MSVDNIFSIWELIKYDIIGPILRLNVSLRFGREEKRLNVSFSLRKETGFFIFYFLFQGILLPIGPIENWKSGPKSAKVLLFKITTTQG